MDVTYFVVWVLVLSKFPSCCEDWFTTISCMYICISLLSLCFYFLEVQEVCCLCIKSCDEIHICVYGTYCETGRSHQISLWVDAIYIGKVIKGLFWIAF